MKRYRFSNFFFDGERNLWKLIEEHSNALQIGREGLKQELAEKYGSLDLENKIKRFLEINPPTICIVLDYRFLMYETINAFVSGQYYPAVTGACCIGEAIYNSLILRLRKYYTSHPLYKNVHSKNSFQNWDESISILSSWGILNSELKVEYEQLLDIRKKSIHLRNVSDYYTQALQAINIIMLIVDNLFGLKSDILFWCPGEIYIKKEKESIPIVKEFFIPACILLGYKHKVKSDIDPNSSKFTYVDANDYEDGEISDQQFRELRIQAQKQS
jgi:hypothetical protein